MREHPLTEEAFSKLSNSVEIGCTYTIRGKTSQVYKVEGKKGTYHVDLENRTCNCREFELDSIPCRHAYAATYAPHIMLVPHPNAWDVPVQHA